jgi:hypothetical protein
MPQTPAERPCPHDELFASSGNDRQSQPRALACKLAHQRQRIDLVAERHECGDDNARCDREGKNPRSYDFRSSLACVRRQRIAPRRCLAAQCRLQIFDES